MARDEWISVTEAASALGISPRTITDRARRLHDGGDSRIRWASGRGGQRREIHQLLLDEWAARSQEHSAAPSIVQNSVHELERGLLQAENRDLRDSIHELEKQELRAEIRALQDENERLRRALAVFTEPQEVHGMP